MVDHAARRSLRVEYQGQGHYHERSFMRDAVKREAFRKANVAFVEIPAEFRHDEVREMVAKSLRRPMAFAN